MIENIQDIKVEITVIFGSKKMSIQEIMKTNHGSIIELNTKVGEPLVFCVNGKRFGTCEIVKMQNEKLGMKIIEIFKKK